MWGRQAKQINSKKQREETKHGSVSQGEGVWSLVSKHIVQCLNTKYYCSKTKKICWVDHSGTGVFEKYCSKYMFKTMVFEITFGLIFNNKN